MGADSPWLHRLTTLMIHLLLLLLVSWNAEAAAPYTDLHPMYAPDHLNYGTCQCCVARARAPSFPPILTPCPRLVAHFTTRSAVAAASQIA